jgi:hypothetical protein
MRISREDVVEHLAVLLLGGEDDDAAIVLH